VSQQDRDKWNARYRDGAYGERPHPSQFVERWAPRLLANFGPARVSSAEKPRALDLACGAGRNALWLAASGFSVDAVDIAAAGLALARARSAGRAGDIDWHEHDLDEALPARLDGYDLIIVMRYLNRELFPSLPQRLRPGGTLLCEVHLQTDTDVVGPGNPAFRVAPGELAGLFPGLAAREFEEGMFEDPDGRLAALARFAGVRPG